MLIRELNVLVLNVFKKIFAVRCALGVLAVKCPVVNEH